jgi:hypothetical protein
MTVPVRSRTAAAAVVSLLFLANSCSDSGPAPPQKGSPAFYWQAASETYKAGDYQKTIEHLEQIAASDNEYSARAQPWLLVMTSGVARGYMQLADAFELAARARPADQGTFRRQMNDYRAAANRAALQFAENFDKFQKQKSDSIPLAFAYPTGSATPVQALDKAASGAALGPAELDTAQRRTLERSILLEACRAVGAPDDTAKAQASFKSENPQVARSVFVMAMADSLHRQAQLYSRMKMDDPNKYKIFSSRASEALGTIPESKESKELRLKIDGELKKLK